MPTYEYRCPKGHDFEKFYRSISAAPVEVHCPECGALAVRELSGGSLVFKGSGFYITDYGKDGKKDQQKAAVAAESPTGEKSDSGAGKPVESAGDGGGSESKPDAKSTSSADDAKSSRPKQDTKPAAAPASSKSKDKK